MLALRALSILKSWEGMDIPEFRPTLHAWRAGKWVVHFDADLYDALCRSEIDWRIPAGYFRRLPGSCVYIATPGWRIFDKAVHGSFVASRDEYFDFILDREDTIWPVWDIVTATEPLQEDATFLTPLISLALYLCTSNVEPLAKTPDRPCEVWARCDGDLPKQGLWTAKEDGRSMKWINGPA